MLVKLGDDWIINTASVSFVHLYNYSQAPNEACLTIAFTNGTSLHFWGKEADILRWYLNDPASDVIDIRNFKEG